MIGYGRWLQLSVFHCRLDGGRRAEMAMALETLIDRETDHVLILNLGPADGVKLAVESLGNTFAPIERRAVVI
jgi:CRISPR-associated protein Cas2